MRIHEDFYPIDENIAYVTTGVDYARLDQIECVEYRRVGFQIVISQWMPIFYGEYLRLGNIYEGKLFYSSRGIGIPFTDIKSKTAHQPYMTDRGLYYADDAPTARIYKDGELCLDHWDDFVEIGHPTFDGDWMYFEARRKDNPAPFGWEIWRQNIQDGSLEYLGTGANPYVLNGNIFYTHFATKTTKVKTIEEFTAAAG